jgi:hypothetical protein
MTGNLSFGATSGLGLTWGLNTDAAFIKFISSGNQAGGSYLEIGTQDDLDEEIKFTQSGNLRFYLATDGRLKTGSGYNYVWENGTWAIGITGNAGTVTNGVYTNGSYANPSWITSLAWSKITGAPAFITGYTETDTLASVTGRGATTSTTLTLAKVITTGLYGPSTSGNIAIWQYDASSTGYGIVYNEGSPDTLRIDVSGQALSGTPDFLVGSDYAQINGNTVWHAGNLTNLNQLTNGPGYITSSGRAYPRRSDGNDINFIWSGQSGQPTWLWGGTDGTNMYVYNPSNFSVNYATSAGSASTAGYADEAKWINFPDGPRDLSDRRPNWNNRSVAWDFVTAGTADGVGNYAGVMTFSPWDGTSGSTGDSSYQLAFINETGLNASGIPGLRLRNGIDSAWNSTWYKVWHSGHFSQTNINNWTSAYNDVITSAAVSGTTTKTLTLTQRDGGTVTASWTDIDTDTNTDQQTLSLSGSTLSISGGNSVTLPSGGISQGTADSLYVNISGDEMTGNLYISPISANPAQIQLAGSNPELYVSAKTGTARVFINRQASGNQATLMFTTGMNVFQGTAWDYTGVPMWSMGMTNNNNTDSFKIAYGDIYEPTSVALEITTANVAYFKYVPYAAGNLLATQSWVQSQGYLTSVSDVWVNTTGDTMTGNLQINARLGISKAPASNESIVVDNPEGTWLIHAFRGATDVGGIHTNSGAIYIQHNGSGEIRLSTQGNATWNGDILATRPWVTSQGYLTSLPSHNHDDRYYTETEVNNFFSGATGITGYNKSNWDAAYGWGNHAGLYASSSHTHTFASLTSKPTTISGYGITDAITTGNIGSQSVNYSTYAAYVENDSYYMRFHWNGQSGQPTWLWGGNEGENMYVYNPSNFNVNYANSAGSVAWGNITGVPSTFTPASHTHDDRYYTESESDSRFLRGTTNPGSVGNFTISIGNNGTYSYVQSHSGQPLRLNPVGNPVFVDSTLTVSGDVTGNNLNISNWNVAYNKRPTAIAFSGGSTKTLTLTQGDGSTLTASFSDIDTDTNTDAQTLTLNGSTLSISGGNSITLPSGGISQGTADSLYVNVGGDTMTGALRINGSTLGQELFAVDGTNGRLFTVTDDLSDSLYSVNTIAGLPVLEVFANNVVQIGKFGTNAIYVGQDGRVGFGTTNFSYTVSDVSGVTGTPNNNRVFVNGSIQLLSDSDGFVVGRGGASFFKDEEIAFGWGGGWFMQDATYLRVRGNKMIYSGGSARFDDSLYLGGQTYRFYSANSGTWTNGNFGAEGDIYFGTRGTWLSSYLNQALLTSSAPTFTNIYNNSWFRNNNSNEGLYNQVTTQHWSSNTNGYWDASSTTSVSAIRFYTGGHVSSIRGYVYANTSNEIGFLNSGGNWGLRMDNNYNVQVYGQISAINFSGSSSGTNTGDQTNISGNAATATNVAWTGVTNRPTALSQFTNDLGNYGGFLTSLPAHSHAWTSITSKPAASNWNTNGNSIDVVVGMLSWKNYGDGHVIFDASRSTSPSGSAVSNTNPDNYWTGTYPTLMGWNGSNTYGVRVDVSRYSDSTGSVAWSNVSSRPTALSQFTNDLGNYGSWQSASTAITTSNIGSQSVNYASSAGSVAWTNVSSRPTALSQFTNDSGYITTNGRAYPRNAGGGDINFYWSGQSGQPTWLWGGTDGTNMYVYNPSNFSVNYAASAGSVAWTNVSGRPTALSQFTNDLGLGGAAVTIQDSPPAGTAGKLWWESDTGKLKVYYGSAWVDASPIPDMSLYYSKAGGSINGDVTVRQTLTVVGNTLIQGVLTETSDISLKENILPLENSLDKVMKLNGVSFNKKATPNMQEIGFIAQEVEAIIPDLVTETGEGIKTVSYSRVTAVLVETIKEQQTQINELKEMVNILTKKLDNL